MELVAQNTYETINPVNAADQPLYDHVDAHVNRSARNECSRRRVITFAAAALVFVSLCVSAVSLTMVFMQKSQFDEEIVGLSLSGEFGEPAGPKTCPDSRYVLSPASQTCLRLVSRQKIWNDAKDYCEDAGEHLVTFRTYQAAEWYATYSKRWGNYLWIGLSGTDDAWRWAGIATGYQFPGIDRWTPDQPPSNSTGLCAYSDSQYWHPYNCNYHNRFVCESEV